MMELIIGAGATLIGMWLYRCEVGPIRPRRKVADHEPRAIKLLTAPVNPHPRGGFEDCRFCHTTYAECERVRHAYKFKLPCCSKCYHRPPPTAIPGDGMPVSR